MNRFASSWVMPSCRARARSEEHTSELQSQSNLVCRLLLEKKKSALCVRLNENAHELQSKSNLLCRSVRDNENLVDDTMVSSCLSCHHHPLGSQDPLTSDAS